MKHSLHHLLVAVCLLTPSIARADYTVAVDPATARQTLEGWGTSLAWFANGAGGWADPQRNSLADALFNQSTGLGLTWIRYNIGGGDAAGLSPAIPFPNNVPGYQPTAGTYDWTQDANQRWMAAAARSRGGNLFEAVSYSPPYWMTNSGSSQGGVNGVPNLATPFYGSGAGSFADYLTTVVQKFRDSWGITFRNLEPLNEPAQSWWKAGNGKQEGCAFTAAQQDTVIQDVGASLAAKGLLTKIAAMDEYSIDTTNSQFNGYSSAAKAYMTQINAHSYAGSGRSTLAGTAAGAGKRITQSEWGSNDITGQDLSTTILNDVNNMRVTAWSIWQPNWPGLMTIDYTNQTFTLQKAYYAYKNFTQFIRPGYQFIATADPNSLAAYNANTGTLAIVTLNWTANSTNVTYNLAGFSSTGSSAAAYRTSSTENLVSLGDTTISNRSFTHAAAPMSVTTYVITNAIHAPTATSINDNTTGSGLNQFNYFGSWSYYGAQSGAYQGDNHWSWTANDYYTVQFSGIQGRVYGSKAPNAGIAAFSVDSGAETYVDLYQATRSDNILLYATPTLSNGTHTLKVRVTGLNNSSSTSTIVPADRVDSVTAFTVVNDNTTGTGTNQFDYSGSWSYYGSQTGAYQNDNHWSTTTNNYYKMQFSGTQARVYGSLNSNGGIAAFSVDDGTEMMVDLYAPSRVDNTLLWATPAVASGTHTVKIRVTGTKNALSSGYVIPADRIDSVP